MTPALIGITGTRGVGKSTLAALLAELIPGARVVAFADLLKARVHALVEQGAGLYVPPDQIEAHKGDVFGPLYQGWGQLVREFVAADYWIKALEDRLPDRAIVADVRYPNECDWLKGRGGLLVAITGPNRREGDLRSADHPSESGVPACRARADVLVVNDGSKDLLQRQAGRIVQGLGLP